MLFAFSIGQSCNKGRNTLNPGSKFDARLGHHQLTSFIGREKEIGDVERLFGTTRLLTLTGPGGSGKTRLAIKAATDLAAEYRDGAWFVDLAPLVDPVLLAQTIAGIFGIGESSTASPMEVLQTYLRTKTLLLLFDNCEHLIEGCAQLADTLLRTCLNLRMLVTSREPLNIAGKTTFHVLPLSLPDPGGSSRLEDLMQFESIQLFTARAAAVEPRLQVTTTDVSTIAQICAHLDGMPLAIELAAARVHALSVQQIAEKLKDRFHLLTTGTRTAPTRQQTLRATVDWSYELLSEAERILLRRLSAFAGGWTLEAAESVASDPLASDQTTGSLQNRIGADDVLDLLSHLVEKSLVLVDKRNGEPRYRMLETIRQYAREKLEISGEVERICDRHLEFFMHMAEEADPQLRGPEQVDWLNRLEHDHDNLRAALQAAWDKQKSNPESDNSLLRFAGVLEMFWNKHSHFHEAHFWLQAALENGVNVSNPARAKALGAAGWFAARHSEYEEAEKMLKQSLHLYRQLNDKQNIARILNLEGFSLGDHGEITRANMLFEESLSISRQIGAVHGVSESLLFLAENVMGLGDYNRARQLFEESLSLSRKIGDTYSVAMNLETLSDSALFQREYDQAEVLSEEGIFLWREVGNTRQIMFYIERVGWIAHGRGDNLSARDSLLKALHGSSELGDRWLCALSLEHLAIVTLEEGNSVGAARLFGAAQALRERTNVPLFLATVKVMNRVWLLCISNSARRSLHKRGKLVAR